MAKNYVEIKVESDKNARTMLKTTNPIKDEEEEVTYSYFFYIEVYSYRVSSLFPP